ncbi:MAG: single-stranded-DNA-specific exonuclease RecJ [Clostridiales Family XIII bacterium]|nr:single-stranded-DNA-specific exonuclease RecJ [Clostridiales Family XIII bacterium]
MRTAEEIVKIILAARGLTEPDALSEYFADRPKCTYDPFLLPDMEAGADMIMDGVRSQKNICIYGDYDVDGVMSVVLLTIFLRGLPGVNPAWIQWYVPSRFDEGYGLNTNALDRIRESGSDIVVTVDCGSVSRAEVLYAKEKGLEMVVTDHHDCAEGLDPECPFIDPKRPGSGYPQPQISGCGVAFKLAQAICKKYFPEDYAVKKLMNSMLDLVAVATIADVMPLTGENRTLVKYGLAQINKGDRKALKKLVDAIGLKHGQISAYNIAFGIAPHLNAAGRMGDASVAAELFLTHDETRMDELIAELILRNKERRRIQEEAVETCIGICESDFKDDLFKLVRPPQIHEGVSGIVAGRIKEHYGLPAAVLADTVSDDGRPALKGSARGITGLDLIGILRAHGELFTRLGGHAMAAGFTVPAENAGRLRDCLNDEVRRAAEAAPGILVNTRAADAEIEAAEASLTLAKQLEKLEPTGTGNPMPVLALRGVRAQDVKHIGTEGQHLKFNAVNMLDAGGQNTVSCVLFAKGGEAGALPDTEDDLTLIGTLDVNRWHGRESAQFKVKEVRVLSN